MPTLELTSSPSTHEPRDPEPNEALLLVYPEERGSLEVLVAEFDGLEVIHRAQPGLGTGEFYYV